MNGRLAILLHLDFAPFPPRSSALLERIEALAAFGRKRRQISRPSAVFNHNRACRNYQYSDYEGDPDTPNGNRKTPDHAHFELSRGLSWLERSVFLIQGIGAARAVFGIGPLSDDALQAEPAGMIEDRLSISTQVIIVLDAVARPPERL
jgi:hypothetical protein